MSIINELVNERVNQESKAFQDKLTDMLVEACLPYMDLILGEDFNNTNDEQMEDKKMAKVNLTMAQQLEILNDMGYFPSEEEQTSEKVAEIYAEVQQEQEELAEGIDDPGCTEEHIEKEEEEGRKMLEEIRAKEREEFKTMTLEQLLVNRAITKARVREELMLLEVKPGCSLSREELMTLWFNKMHESKVIVGEVKEVVDTPKEEQIIPPSVENSPIIPPEPKQEEIIQNNVVIPPTQETAPQQEESSDVTPESKPTENAQPAKEWKVKKAKSDADVFGYILWKNRVDEKLYSKAWVGAKNMNWYIKQKYLGKPTWKGCTFTEEEETIVQTYIDKCVKAKWIKPVYKGEDKKLSGYFVSPKWVAWYYLELKMDAVYEAEGVLYVIDYNCQYRFELATGKPIKLSDGVWEYMTEKGKFIGTITRDNAQTFTKFEIPSSTNNDTPPAPVVPQQ